MQTRSAHSPGAVSTILALLSGANLSSQGEPGRNPEDGSARSWQRLAIARGGEGQTLLQHSPGLLQAQPLGAAELL